EFLDRFTYDEARISQPAGLDRSGETFYLVDNRATNTAILRAIDLATGKTRTVVSDPRADIRTGLLFDQQTGRAQSATAIYGRMRRYFFGPSVARDFKYLKTVHTGDVAVAGGSLSDQPWLVVFLGGGALRYFGYGRRAHRARFLFAEQNAVVKYSMARRESVVVKTRDGLMLPGDLYFPSWTHPGKRKYLDQPLPMLVY